MADPIHDLISRFATELTTIVQQQTREDIARKLGLLGVNGTSSVARVAGGGDGSGIKPAAPANTKKRKAGPVDPQRGFVAKKTKSGRAAKLDDKAAGEKAVALYNFIKANAGQPHEITKASGAKVTEPWQIKKADMEQAFPDLTRNQIDNLIDRKLSKLVRMVGDKKTAHYVARTVSTPKAAKTSATKSKGSKKSAKRGTK